MQKIVTPTVPKTDRSLTNEKELRLNIEKLENDLIGYLKYITNDSVLSFDLAQETMARSIGVLSREPEPAKIKPYILKVARNLAIDHFRRSSNQKELLLDTDETVPLTDNENHPNPELLLIQKQEKETFFKIFKKLKPTEKEIITLYYYNDLNLGEIAELLEIPLNTAITKLCRARNELKKKLLRDKTYEMLKR